MTTPTNKGVSALTWAQQLENALGLDTNMATANDLVRLKGDSGKYSSVDIDAATTPVTHYDDEILRNTGYPQRGYKAKGTLPLIDLEEIIRQTSSSKEFVKNQIKQGNWGISPSGQDQREAMDNARALMQKLGKEKLWLEGGAQKEINKDFWAHKNLLPYPGDNATVNPNYNWRGGGMTENAFNHAVKKANLPETQDARAKRIAEIAKAQNFFSFLQDLWKARYN